MICHDMPICYTPATKMMLAWQLIGLCASAQWMEHDHDGTVGTWSVDIGMG